MKTCAWSIAAAILMLTASGCPTVSPATRYFLVAERAPVHGDSYVLPLDDPADIAHARALIDDPESAGAPIVVAKVAPGGHDGLYVNRDLASGGAQWSWRVTEFLGFADFTIEVYDGWPGYLEDNYADFTGSSNSTIGFWSYTVVREVEACELSNTCPVQDLPFGPESPLGHLPR